MFSPCYYHAIYIALIIIRGSQHPRGGGGLEPNPSGYGGPSALSFFCESPRCPAFAGGAPCKREKNLGSGQGGLAKGQEGPFGTKRRGSAQRPARLLQHTFQPHMVCIVFNKRPNMQIPLFDSRLRQNGQETQVAVVNSSRVHCGRKRGPCENQFLHVHSSFVCIKL